MCPRTKLSVRIAHEVVSKAPEDVRRKERWLRAGRPSSSRLRLEVAVNGGPGDPEPCADLGHGVGPAPVGAQFLVHVLTWLSEQARFYDPTPFFLPTELNTNQGPLPSTVQPQPGQVFANFGAQLTYGRPDLILPIATKESTPRDPVDLLRTPSRDPFLGFDRADVPLTPLASRSAVLEISEVGTGRTVHIPDIRSDVVLPTGQSEWQPAEFLFCVTTEGLLGRPVETVSSDVEDVDVFFRDYLEKTLRLGERLTPGMYRVVIGP